MEHVFREGIRLFNAEQYFEAHEALEPVWLKAKGDREAFLHGLIQIAAAFHHYMRGNRAGFCSLLEKGCAKLDPLGAEFEDADLAAFMLQLQQWRQHLRAPSLPAPPLPQIKLIGKPERG
ncbi:MAG: DUF309 domain-containing protein [Acidobacteria bacterium]|nr:MAG: DUF309 domain-containing protein [Acidobacteriota bacterium]